MTQPIRPLPAALLALVLALALLPLPASAGRDLPHTALTPPTEIVPTSGRDLPKPHHNPVQLLSSTADGVIFEVTVPWQSLALESIETGGKGYVNITLPGWSTTTRPGAPALPALTRALGVPFGAALAVRVEAGLAHAVALPAPPPPVAAQTLKPALPAGGDSLPTLPRPAFVLEEDPAVYAGVAPYPGVLAERTGEGVLRQQRVAGIAVYPVQYHPQARSLTVYESLRVTVTFEPRPDAALPPPRAESAAYEQILRHGLLNYASARQWRASLLPSPHGRGAGGEGTPCSPPVPGWRVKVRADGLYRLTYGDLQAAGLPVDVLDPHTLQIFHLGQEIAVEVAGEADGQFDPGDSVVFYGQAVRSKYTRDNVYWLTYGQAVGLRMGSRDGTPGTGVTPEYHQARQPFESNTFYVTRAPGDDDLERWFWDYLYPPSRPSRSFPFSLPAPYTGAYTATLTVAMLGYLDNPISPDHHVRISLNGTQVADVWWDGITWKTAEAEVPQGLLQAGANTLTLLAPNDTGVGVDLVDIDGFALQYADTFLAVDNALTFAYDVTGTWNYRVEGFSSDEVTVYDLTDPAAVARIEGVEVIPSGAGYAALFQDEVTEPVRYYALAPGAYRTVQAIEPDTPSNLASPDNGADHITVTPADFSEQAGALADHRASEGLRALAVDVQDVYDEFGYGLVSPAAIHDFLAYAYAEWQPPAPSYVVLVGDGHYDPKDYYGYGLPSYLPPYLAAVDPWMVETAGDNRYVTLVGGDTLPDMMLGRLSVNSPAQASVLVNKIAAYEVSPAPGDWDRQVLAVTDNPDGAGNFPQMSDALLAAYLPATYLAQKVYYGVTHPNLAEARQAIQTGINTGALLVNYIGHGAQDRWADEGLLTTADIPLLQNGERLPVMLPMTCWDGYYHYPFPSYVGMDAMAEVVTRTEGRGAVASWSPTGFGVATGHSSLDAGFFQAVFQDGIRRLGQATMAGKLLLWASGSNLDLLDTYLLFGDPALRIRALDADLQVSKAVEPEGPVLPGGVLTYTLTFTNAGPAMAHGVVLTDIIPADLQNPQVVYHSANVIGPLPGTAFVWAVADLPPGESGEVRVRAAAPAIAPPEPAVNTAEIAGAEPDPQPGNNISSVTTELPGAMRVGGMGIAARPVSQGRYAVVAKVRITDLGRVPVPGPVVRARWTLPDGANVDQEATADALGRVKFRQKSALLGTYRLCITDLIKPGWVYLPERNSQTCATVAVP